jgi:hypothetical protein
MVEEFRNLERVAAGEMVYLYGKGLCIEILAGWLY